MTRKASRDSFLRRENSSQLAIVYGKLVAIELAIKDDFGELASLYWNHKIHEMLVDFADAYSQKNQNISVSVIKSYAAQFQNKLKKLVCVYNDNHKSHVPINSYPHMRYVVHENDERGFVTKENDIKNLEVLVDNIINELNTRYGLAI